MFQSKGKLLPFVRQGELGSEELAADPFNSKTWLCAAIMTEQAACQCVILSERCIHWQAACQCVILS